MFRKTQTKNVGEGLILRRKTCITLLFSSKIISVCLKKKCIKSTLTVEIISNFQKVIFLVTGATDSQRCVISSQLTVEISKQSFRRAP